jgi:hypothetical protein
MAIKPIPLVTEEEYPNFRRLDRNDFPNTYYEWQSWRDRLRKEAASFDTVDVDVKAGEFSRYCAARKRDHTLHALLNFAEYEMR